MNVSKKDAFNRAQLKNNKILGLTLRGLTVDYQIEEKLLDNEMITESLASE